MIESVTVSINRNDIYKLQRKNWELVKKIEQGTGYQIKVVDQEYPGETPREIGFSGPKEGVAKANKRMVERLVCSSTAHSLAPVNICIGSTTEIEVRGTSAGQHAEYVLDYLP